MEPEIMTIGGKRIQIQTCIFKCSTLQKNKAVLCMFW